MLQAEVNRVYPKMYGDAKRFMERFMPNFEVKDLSKEKKMNKCVYSLIGNFTNPKKISPFNTEETLKVLFEYHNDSEKENKTEKNIERPPYDGYLMYFRMKVKGEKAIKIPENLDKIKKEKNPKYSIFSPKKHKEIIRNFEDSLKPLETDSQYKFFDQSIQNESLNPEHFHKLFGLKHIDYLNSEDLLQIKAKTTFEKELASLKKPLKGEVARMDDITKEIVFVNFELNQFVIPENNVRKERIFEKAREEYQNQVAMYRLQE